MASGKPDYWYGMLPGRSVKSPGQERWAIKNSKEVVSGEEGVLLLRNVPENYRLYITGGIISCNLPGTQVCSISMGALLWGVIYFDQVINLMQDSSGMYYVEEDEQIEIRVNNLDNVDCTFYIILYGFKEYLFS